MKATPAQMLAQLIMEEVTPQGLADSLVHFLGDEKAEGLVRFMIANYGLDGDRVTQAASTIELDDCGMIDNRQWEINFEVSRR